MKTNFIQSSQNTNRYLCKCNTNEVLITDEYAFAILNDADFNEIGRVQFDYEDMKDAFTLSEA